MDNNRSLASKASLITPNISVNNKVRKKAGRKPETTSKYFQESEPTPRRFGTTMSNTDFTKLHKNRAEKFKRMICSEEVSRKKQKIESRIFGQSTSGVIDEDNDAFFDRLWRGKDDSFCEKNYVKRRGFKKQTAKKKRNVFDAHTVKTISEFKVVMKQPDDDEEKSAGTETDESTTLKANEENVSILVEQENILPKSQHTVDHENSKIEYHLTLSQRQERSIFEQSAQNSIDTADQFGNDDLFDGEKVLTPPEIKILVSQRDNQGSQYSDDERHFF